MNDDRRSAIDRALKDLISPRASDLARRLQGGAAALAARGLLGTGTLSTTTADLRVAPASIQLTALEIAKLKAQIARLKRMQFGQSSERLTRVIDQLELRLEDLETQEGAEISAATAAGLPEPETRRARRLPLPEQLPRRDIVHPGPAPTAVSAAAG